MRWDVDVGEFPGAKEVGQSQCIAAIGFDPAGGALGNEGGTDQFAHDALGAEMPAEGEAGGTGLVEIADFGAVFAETPVQFVEGVGVGGNVAVGAELPGGIGDGHGDGFGMDIEADVLNF